MDSIAGGNRQADNTVKEEHMAWKASLKHIEEPLQIRSCHLFVLGAAHEVAGEDRKGPKGGLQKNEAQMMVHWIRTGTQICCETEHKSLFPSNLYN